MGAQRIAADNTDTAILLLSVYLAKNLFYSENAAILLWNGLAHVLFVVIAPMARAAH